MAEAGARSLVRGAGLLVAALAVVGCSPAGSTSESSVPSTTVTTAPIVAVATLPPDVPTTTAAPVPTTPFVDGAALLGQALDAIVPGYHFTTTVTVDGVVTLTADGDRVADGTRLSLTGQGAVVAYVITPDGTWVQPDGGTWEALDSGPANTDPIAALKSPTTVQVDGVDATVTRLTTTVPATALGIPGDPATVATVQVAIDGTTLHDITYSATVDGRAATVQAVIGPVVDPTPVTPPV